MSGQPHLLIVADPRLSREQVLAEAKQVLDHWPEAQRPVQRIVDLAQVLADHALLDDAAVVWLLAETRGGSTLYELIALVQDRRLPTVLSCPHLTESPGTLYQEGVVLCAMQSDPAIACAMLRSMWSQTPALAELQGELNLLQRHHGGLAGRIDRMDEELRLAAQLQREFLPIHIPQIKGFDFRVLWRPASYVSGDIYDVIRLDENHVGLFVADAVGHGVPAALMTMYIKRSLHTKTISPSLPGGYRLDEPSEVLGKLNRDLINRDSDHVRFATACYAVVDCRTCEVRLARAGHPFPIILRADGSTEQAEPDGGLLGVFPNEVYEQTTLQLHAGDRLVLYSDGFEVAFPGPGKEARVASMQYCEEFEDLRHGRLEEAVHRLEAKLDSQSGSLNQRDDLTIVCMAVTGLPQRKEKTRSEDQPAARERASVAA